MRKNLFISVVGVVIAIILLTPLSSFAFRGNGGYGDRHGNYNRGGHGHGGYHRGGRSVLPGIAAGIGAAIIYNTVIRPRYDYPPPAYVVPPSVYGQPDYFPATNCDQFRTQGERDSCRKGLAEAEATRQRDAEAQAYQAGRNAYPNNYRRW